MKNTTKAKLAGILGGAVAATLLAVTPAAASSTVNVGGHANCASMLGGTQAAQQVTIKLDATGESRTVSTGLFNDVYRMTFPSMPKAGTGATMTVKCGPMSVSPGNHSKRVFLKPDWRNTTGDTNWTRAS